MVLTLGMQVDEEIGCSFGQSAKLLRLLGVLACDVDSAPRRNRCHCRKIDGRKEFARNRTQRALVGDMHADIATIYRDTLIRLLEHHGSVANLIGERSL